MTISVNLPNKLRCRTTRLSISRLLKRKAPVAVEAASTSTSDTESKAEAPTSVTADVEEAKETQTPKQQKTKTAENVSKSNEAQSTQADSNSASTSNVSNSALELTHEALFGTRYVTAEKFGQASNDPRVVLAQQAAQANKPAATNVPAIRGTVGEFIRATLPEAQTRLAEEGIINCFIATIALHNEQSQSADNSSDAASQSFDFSNYGYQPLAADYLARFEVMTQAVSQFAAAQGKTDVEPRAITKRASNDPRGQHPDYQEPTVLSVPAEQATVEQTNNEVDAHDVEATALANQTQTENVSADSEHLLEVERAQSEAKDAEVEIPAEQTGNEVENAAENVLETEQTTESVVVEATKEASKDDSQAAKSKTTIASYKNMIENVAEQLLPQTGMFNLTTPKVPKARSRKPKMDHKKPTQAEKLASDDVDSDS